MNITQAQDPVMNLYPVLDELQELFKILNNSFRATVSGLGDIQLMAKQVQDASDKYMSLRSKIQKLANSIPEFKDLQ